MRSPNGLRTWTPETYIGLGPALTSWASSCLSAATITTQRFRVNRDGPRIDLDGDRRRRQGCPGRQRLVTAQGCPSNGPLREPNDPGV
jgi:hypothetical protein